MAIEDQWTPLEEAVARDSWEECEAWALTNLKTPGVGGAASSVCEVLEQDRPNRGREEHGPGLTQTLRESFSRLVRLRRLAARGGEIEEPVRASVLYHAVVVRAGEARVAMAGAWTRPTLVAADASSVRTPRAMGQLVGVLGALAFQTEDVLRIDRDFSLAIGHVCRVDERRVHPFAPLYPSQYRIERGAALAPWLDEPDVVSVTPAGGRLALANEVAQLEQRVRTAHQRIAADGRLRERDLDTIRDALELLRGHGWTPEIEPLSSRAAVFLAALEAHEDDLDALVAALVPPQTT